MSTIKTLVNDGDVADFIQSVEDQQKIDDSLVLLKMFSNATNEPAKMWGTSIIGFGAYHYKSERSRQEGDWPLVAFSPRKQNLSLYVIYPESEKQVGLLEQLGKHKSGKGCLYIQKLSDVDLPILEQIIRDAYTTAIQVHAAS